MRCTASAPGKGKRSAEGPLGRADAGARETDPWGIDEQEVG